MSIIVTIQLRDENIPKARISFFGVGLYPQVVEHEV